MNSGAWVAIFLPTGYVFFGLVAARLTLNHYIGEDGRYNFRDDPYMKATTIAMFWPVVGLGWGFYLCRNVLAFVQPKAYRERRKREWLAQKINEARWAREATDNRAREAERRTKQLAEANGLPYPDERTS